MSNHVVFSRDSEKCLTCEMYEECKNKRMELCAAAYLPTAAMPSASSMIPDMAITPNLRDVKIAENTSITIDLEEIKQKIYDSVGCKFIRRET